MFVRLASLSGAAVFFLLLQAAPTASEYRPSQRVADQMASTSLPIAEWELTDEDEPLVLQGYEADQQIQIHLPAGWRAPAGGTLEAQVAAGEISRPDASLRIDLDGRPVTTWSAGQSGRSIRQPIPTKQFERPFDLSLSTTSPLVDELDCIDPNHVARWVDLGAPVVRARIEPSDLDVARAIAGIGPISALTDEPVIIVLDDPNDQATVEALGHAVSAIGRHGRPEAWVVAEPGRTFPPGARIEIDAVADGSTAVVELDLVDDRPVLRLTGGPVELVELTRALADPERLLFFHDDVVISDDIPAPRAPTHDEVYSFDDADYDDRTVRGFGAKALVYRIHIPAGVPPDSATLAVFGTYAPTLAADEATLSVKINGSVDEIVAVLDPTGQLSALHTVTPADLRPGLNFVTVEAQLGSQSGSCSSGDSAAWFTVSNQTAIGVNRPDDPVPVEIGVEDARFSLATQLDFDATDVAVPDDHDVDDLSLAASLIGELAARSQGGSPRLVADQHVDRNRHLVVVGEADDRGLLADVPYLDGGRSVGVVATTPSPYAEGRVFLAFSGGNQADVERAIEAAMSSDVNDIATPYALVSQDLVRRVESDIDADTDTEPPGPLAFDEGGRVVGPAPEAYEEWIVDQAARIEAANSPARDRRRTIALTLAFVSAAAAGAWWLRRARSNADVGDEH